MLRRLLSDTENKYDYNNKSFRDISDNIETYIKGAQRRMSDNAAAIRNAEGLKCALDSANAEIAALSKCFVKDKTKIYLYYKLKDILITQSAVLNTTLVRLL